MIIFLNTLSLKPKVITKVTQEDQEPQSDSSPQIVLGLAFISFVKLENEYPPHFFAEKYKSREEIADFFWQEKDIGEKTNTGITPHSVDAKQLSLVRKQLEDFAQKKLKRTYEYIKRLNKQGLLRSSKGAKQIIPAALDSDVVLLYQAMDNVDIEEIRRLYQAPFLYNYEQKKTLRTEAIENWITSTRSHIQEDMQRAVFKGLEKIIAQGHYGEAFNIAQWLMAIDKSSELLSANQLELLHQIYRANNVDATPINTLYHSLTDLNLQELSQHRAQRELQRLHNVLPSAGLLYGREALLEKWHQDILNDPSIRLLSITGVIGIGKTSFAAELAQRLYEAQTFRDGVVYIDLADCASGEEILQSITAKLLRRNLPFASLLTELSDFLSQKSLVLLLDGADHIAYRKEIIKALLLQCKNLLIITVGCYITQLQQEYICQLTGLDWLHEKASDNQPLPALALLSSNIKQVSRLSHSPYNHYQLSEICRCVEGIPQLIIMVAPLCCLLPFEDLRESLENNRSDWLIKQDAQGNAYFQRSLELIWQSLNSGERTLLAKLTIFKGFFSFEAVRALIDVSIFELMPLLNKSLLSMDKSHTSSIPFYHISKLISSFLRDKIEIQLVPEEMATMLTTYSHFYLEKLELLTTGTTWQRNTLLPELKKSWLNIYEAWRIAVEQKNYDLLERNIHALVKFTEMAMYVPQGIALLSDFEQALTEDTPNREILRGKILASQAWLHYQISQLDEAIIYADKALTLLDDTCQQARRTAFNTLGGCYEDKQDYQKALTFFDKTAEFISDEAWLYNMYSNHARLWQKMGKYEKAYELIEKCRIFHEVGKRKRKLPGIYYQKAIILQNQSKTVDAIEYLNKCINICKETNMTRWLDRAFVKLIELYISLGEWEIAEDYYTRATKIMKRQGFSFVSSEFQVLSNTIPKHKK